MLLETQRYLDELERWPEEGRHVMAQFDEHSVMVYQAYRPSIGRYAAEHGFFGGPEFSFSRMSWIKPNFLWMMYRSGWGTKPDQEVVLAIRLVRSFFDDLLDAAVPSSFDSAQFESREAWQRAVRCSAVRLQWDPDHDPLGAPVRRRAIQLGLRGDVLEGFRGSAILGIEDVSAFVAEQREALRQGRIAELVTPREDVYPVRSESARRRLGLAKE